MHGSELFKGTAHYYAKYRKGYPDTFFDFLIKNFKLTSSSRLLDLGTGTGQIALKFAPKIKEVVAVDPDIEMLDEGKRVAATQKVSNIRWIHKRAEEIDEGSGFFDMTTMGASFHWMEQDLVLQRIYDITSPGGVVVIVANTSSIHRNLGNDQWKDTVLETIQKYLGKQRRAGKTVYQEPKDRFEDVLERSNFTPLKTYTESYTQDWDVDSILGFLSSTSFAARHLFGEQITDFENELTEKLLQLEPSGQFTETAVLEALLGQKV